MTLYRLRLSKGLSLRRMASLLGMAGHGGLSDYEKGLRIPPEDLVVAYERALKVRDGQLRELREQALAERAEAMVRDSAAAPVAELPADIADFTGRAAEIADIEAAAITVISGKPGVGKTALAVHVAHRNTAAYPDVQLYCDLSGVHNPADPSEVLGRVLRALGVAASQVPGGLDERAALYRSLLAGRRALVVLDNAATETQVRPLLPGAPHCLTMITSRSRLAGLSGVHRLTLTAPDTDAAVTMLAEIIGQGRVCDEPHAAAELVTACGQLPLAVRIVGNRLTGWPEWSLQHLVGRLADERQRLTWLKAGDLDARAAFGTSYAAISTDHQLLFRRLGLVPGPDFGAELAAALTGAAPEVAEQRLDDLAAASLIEPSPFPGRYQFHDLLRLYAKELVDADPERDAVAEAMVDWLLRTAICASVALAPPGQAVHDSAGRFDGDWDGAVDWLDAERDNVVGAARLANDHRVGALVADFAWYLDLRAQWEIFRDLSELAQFTAPDLGSAAMAWNCLGLAYSGLCEFGEAARCHQRAAELAGAAGDLAEEAHAYDKLGVALWGLGRFAEAVGHHRRTAEIGEQLGDDWLRGGGLSHLGYALNELRRFAEAEDVLREASRLAIGSGYDRSLAMRNDGLGVALSGLGRFAEAKDCHEQALVVFLATGDRWAEAMARHGLGVALAGLGRTTEALEQIGEANRMFGVLNDRLQQAHVLRSLGMLVSCTNTAAARPYLRQSLDRYRELGVPQADEVRRLLAELDDTASDD